MTRRLTLASPLHAVELAAHLRACAPPGLLVSVSGPCVLLVGPGADEVAAGVCEAMAALRAMAARRGEG